MRRGDRARLGPQRHGAGINGQLAHLHRGLSEPQHVRDHANGCPFAALGGDVPRESETIRAAFSNALERSIDALAARLGHKGEAPGREDAIEALATMVGARVLARTAAPSQLRDEILGAARNKLLEAPRT